MVQLVAVVIVIFGIPLVFWFLPARPYRTRTIDSNINCRRVLIRIDLLEPADVASLLTNGNTDSLSLNRKTAALLLHQKVGGELPGKLISRDGLFHDGWESPLVFATTNDISFTRLNPRLKWKPRALIVWSPGPNKTNEFGFGDDVFSED